MNHITKIPVPNSEQSAWLLVNLAQDPKKGTTLKQLYKESNHPRKIEWLYHTTTLDPFKERGPALLEVTNTILLDDFIKQPNEWTAFLLYTQANEQNLLEHLRNLLVVRFYQEEKGILNYTDPRVAEFFFNMPEEQLGRWLGVIDEMYWWGGDFIATANNRQSLRSVQNPLAPKDRSKLQVESSLTAEQEQLLGQCQEQQSVWEWGLDTNTHFQQAWQYYQEAKQLDFTHNDIESYMLLRTQHPTKPLLTEYPEQITMQQKIQLIQSYWNNKDTE